MSSFSKSIASMFALLFVGVVAHALANPASIYCLDHNGRLEERSSSLGAYGVCVFEEDGVRSECEEWYFALGECSIGQCTRVSQIVHSDGSVVMECYND